MEEMPNSWERHGWAEDADGEPFIQKMIEVAKSKGKGWVDYKWTNP